MIVKWKLNYKVQWTNWTFGIWWGKIGRYQYRAFDLGPLQMWWKRSWR